MPALGGAGEGVVSGAPEVLCRGLEPGSRRFPPALALVVPLPLKLGSARKKG